MSLKFEVMLYNNQNGKMFYFIGWLSLIVLAQIFFFNIKGKDNA